MNTLKYILMGIGIIAIVLSVVFLIIGAQVVSTVLYYLIMVIAIIAVIGFAIYLWGRYSGSKN